MRLHSQTGTAILALGAGLMLTLGAPAGAQQDVDWDAVQVTPHQVADNIYYLEGRGGNIGVMTGPDGIVMIDDQFAQLTDKIMAALRSISDQPVRLLINTHVHGDHTGGNANIGAMGVPIVAQNNVRKRLAAGSDTPKTALPIMTYARDLNVHLDGEDVRVFSFPPAHTDGDSAIYFPGADVLHVGDVFRTTGFPVIDLSNGGSTEGTLQALDMIIGVAGPSTRIIPGHGRVSSREDVEEFRDMVATVAQRVADMVDDGDSLEQVMQARPTAEYEGRWGDPERFVTALYQDMSAGN